MKKVFKWITIIPISILIVVLAMGMLIVEAVTSLWDD